MRVLILGEDAPGGLMGSYERGFAEVGIEATPCSRVNRSAKHFFCILAVGGVAPDTLPGKLHAAVAQPVNFYFATDFKCAGMLMIVIHIAL